MVFPVSNYTVDLLSGERYPSVFSHINRENLLFFFLIRLRKTRQLRWTLCPEGVMMQWKVIHRRRRSTRDSELTAKSRDLIKTLGTLKDLETLSLFYLTIFPS